MNASARTRLPGWACLLLALLLAGGCAGAAGPPAAPPAPLPPGQALRSPTVPSPGDPGGTLRRIGADALAATLPAGRVLLLDVRDPVDYAIRRLPGARSFPLSAAAAHLDDLPRDRPIVAYCA